jgi:hypothetical protein
MRQILVLAAVATFISTAPSCVGAQAGAQDDSKRYCSNWAAWHDSQPTQKATLHVKGDCAFPTTGYTVKLKPAMPQGFNPNIYVFELIIHIPVDKSARHPVNITVTYDEQTDKRYTDVQITPDNVTIPVKEVSAATTDSSANEKETDTAEIRVPVVMSGIVATLQGIDFCMDGAMYQLQTINGPARLKTDKPEVQKFLDNASGKRLRVTIVGYPVWGPECGHVDVFYAAPTQDAVRALGLTL